MGLRCGFPPLTVMAGVRHGGVVLEMPVLVLRHRGGEAAVSAPVGVGICDRKQTRSASLRLERHMNTDVCTPERLTGGSGADCGESRRRSRAARLRRGQQRGTVEGFLRTGPRRGVLDGLQVALGAGVGLLVVVVVLILHQKRACVKRGRAVRPMYVDKTPREQQDLYLNWKGSVLINL